MLYWWVDEVEVIFMGGRKEVEGEKEEKEEEEEEEQQQ